MNARQTIQAVWTLVLATLIAYSVAQASAAESTQLRASLANPGPILVGEHVTIRVDLLITTMFASAPVFELPTIPGALLMKLEDRPVLGTEQIDGESYAVQHHELALFVMRPGVAQVPPFTVRFESPPKFAAKPIEHRLTTPALRVEARMPPGAENLPGLIASRELRVDQTWQPQPGKARVGDAFTRTVTLMAPDVPGMVLPPLPLARVDGLAEYPKPPVVQDQVERGDFTGKRIETVTYICERPGQFTLPALVIPWWDLKSQKLMQVTLPTVTWEVDSGPGSSAAASAAAGEAPNRQWLWWTLGAILLLAAVGAVIWRKRDTWLAVWQRRQITRQSSESRYFVHLLDTCRTGDAKEAYNALLSWLDSTHHGPDTATIEDFLVHHPDPELRRQVEALQESMLGRATHWDGAALADALRRARRQHIRLRTTANETQLPALNPH